MMTETVVGLQRVLLNLTEYGTPEKHVVGAVYPDLNISLANKFPVESKTCQIPELQGIKICCSSTSKVWAFDEKLTIQLKILITNNFMIFVLANK